MGLIRCAAMARPLRVEFAGAVYHVMARGNERRNIFRDDKDRQRLYDTLAEAVQQFGLRLHAFCFMANHYHLVLGTPQANLSRAMGWLQTTYTVRFNARHRRSGHLFQGRFKAQLVEADEYARWLVEYVHLNPVRPRQRAAVVPPERAKELAQYRWSSHRAYAGLERRPATWLCLDWLVYWGGSRRPAQREYRKAMGRAFGREVSNPWQGLRRGLVLGGEELLRKSEQLLEKKGGLEEVRWTQTEETARVRAHMKTLIEAEGDERVKIWARVRLGNERGVDVAREMGYRSSSAITMLVRRLEQRAVHEKTLRQTLERLRRSVGSEK
jgi:putative transposase